MGHSRKENPERTTVAASYILYLYLCIYEWAAFCISQTVWLSERARVACAMLQKCSNSLLFAFLLLYVFIFFCIFTFRFGLSSGNGNHNMEWVWGLALDWDWGAGCSWRDETRARPKTKHTTQNKMMQKARGAAWSRMTKTETSQTHEDIVDVANTLRKNS